MENAIKIKKVENLLKQKKQQYRKIKRD